MKKEWSIYTFEKTQKLCNGIELQPIGSVITQGAMHSREQ